MNAESQAVLDLTCALIAQRSNTPDDAGCCEILASRLRPLGFQIEYLNAEGVTNLWATRGSGRPLTILAGHTDIVPTGPLEQWTSPPFAGTVRTSACNPTGKAARWPCRCAPSWR